MKLPMSWLNDYTDVSGISPKEYAHVMTMTGSKVEGVESMGAEINKVVCGKVLECEPHPDSDHLSVCKVDAGTGEVLQIVCGAPNVKAGIIVPTALHGSTLPGGVKIKKGKLRGVVSNGMLCSHDELGLTAADLGYEPEYGILILPEDTPVGKDIKEVFGLNEDVVEFEITSNRPDCFSVIGLARETAASFKRPFAVKKPCFTEAGGDIHELIDIQVQNKEKCLRYTSKMVRNVKIGPSPEWMVRRLKACGVRSINNIVDITNYVLLEYGQPMHAFDLRDLAGGKIVVRSAHPGEIIKTLDETDRKLTPDDLVIADGEKAVAVAGVMGGFNSEVKPDTQTVVFESATFDGTSVRKTAQRIGLRTEASSRYEKGLDVYNTLPAVERACQLVEELGCGEIVGGTIDIFGNRKEKTTLALRPEKINAFLGTDISKEQMIEILRTLEFEVDEAAMTITAPTFRPDIECEADISEEIARFYGYDLIPTTLLSGETTIGIKNKEQQAEDRLSSVMLSQGFNEICTYTFTSPSVFDKLNIPSDSDMRNVVKIRNPLGEDTSVMRTTTLGSMLETLSRNLNFSNKSAKLFEIGRIYIPREGELPEEPEILTLGMYGDSFDFYDIKGACEAVISEMHVKDVSYEQCTDNPTFHPGRCACITAGDRQIGVVGQLHPSVAANYDIDVPVYAAQIELEGLMAAAESTVKYKQLPKFPAVTRDIAMLVDVQVPVAALEGIITAAGGKLMESVQLFDVYEGKQIPEGKKSVAYSVVFRAADRSLTNDEVNVIFDKMLKNLEKEAGAQLR
ncbi:MAG: phenylalanine--tRNA ligase subunit beta [Clostridia bacterium]|nr:phenylalanine--tRNA ligase subunit beta [Clostridia bacterium]